MLRNLRNVTKFVSVTAALSLAAISSANAVSEYYGWCWSAALDSSNHKMFYSTVFAVPSTQNQSMMNRNFGDYVRRHYPGDNTGPGECGTYNDSRTAQAYLDQHRNNS